MESILEEIRRERQRQDEQWGHHEQLHPPGTWAMIVMEELGEACQAFVQRDLEHARRELVQVAAVVVQWLEIIDLMGDDANHEYDDNGKWEAANKNKP